MAGGGEAEEINKDELADDWCFVCKEGGGVRICDYKDCLKSYHPSCVNKDDSFLESETEWDCAWHNCFRCCRSKCSYLHCYTCPNAVCRKCLPSRPILSIKGKYGFCKACLKLALLIEEKRDCDSDGEKVDFTDRETFEGLHMEYYLIVKEKEGFEMGDIYAAKNRVKAEKNYQPNYDEEEEMGSDYDDNNEKGKRKRSKPTKKSSLKPNKIEFIGWASTSLVEFLSSIGKNITEKLSQHDVTSIVNDYIKENKLINPGRSKSIKCDARLHRLFRKRTIGKYRVFDLLEEHFAENHESEEDELGYDSEDSHVECKRQRKVGLDKNRRGKTEEIDVPRSRFASIGVENIKLVYLRRGVLKEMLKEPESFEEKVTGCFVRIKSQQYDYRSTTSHQLIEVKGVISFGTEENSREAVLLLSAAIPEEININLLSDEDFTEEECNELRNKILAAEVERPTVEFLQLKVNAVHKDVTNYWIGKELRLLQNRIDQAHEKGWRRELFEFLDRRKRLQSPAEQSRLLQNVPTVMWDAYAPNDCGDWPSEEEDGHQHDHPSPPCRPKIKNESVDGSSMG